jgi:hypothetical protein
MEVSGVQGQKLWLRRDIRCTVEVPGLTDEQLAGKESVAWSIPYLIPCGSEFLPAGADTSVIGKLSADTVLQMCCQDYEDDAEA